MRYLLFCLGLAACTTQSAITAPPVEVKFTSEKQAARPHTVDFVEVRTTTGGIGRFSAVENASCTLTGQGYQAKFFSPAILALPLYRGNTSDAVIQCQASVDGRLVADKEVVKSTNLSAPEREGLTISTGTSGTSVGAVLSIRDRSKDRFDYPSKVTLHLR